MVAPVTTSAAPRRLPLAAGPLLVAIFVVALNLRTPLASVPPLVLRVERELGLSGAGAGLLTTLPVLCMGVFAPGGQRLAHRIGREAAVAVALALLVAGTLLRLGGSVAMLYAGTLAVGVGIAVCGTVLPGIVKEFFPHRPGAVTGVYMLAMMLGATAAAALAVPLADLLGGWRASLGAWSLLALVGLLAWLPVLRRVNDHEDPDGATTAVARVGLPWRSATAWTLAAYLSLQSWQFYSQLAWVSPSYEARGWSAAAAGGLLAVFSLLQIVSGVGGPALADRTADRRPVVALFVGCSLAGLGGLTVAPDAAPWLWVVLLGLGQGGAFAVGLVLLVDHAADAAASARLSAMVFLVSYSLAALGPLVFGALRDLTGGFTVPWASLLVLVVVQLATVVRLRPGTLVDGSAPPRPAGGLP